MAGGFASCVEDEGNYDLNPVNEIIISGIEDSYSRIAYSESLSISPVLECTAADVNEDDLEYKWFICEGLQSLSQHKHTIIGSGKNLNYPLNIAPGTYTIYFQVKDNTTGLKWEKYFFLQTVSQFVRGLYLFGDKTDGTCGIDFVSMMDGRDTVIVKDIFTNSPHISRAQNLIFTGGYNEYSALWAVTESGSYSLEYSSSLENIDVRTEVSTDKFIYPTLEVKKPLKVMNVCPNAYGASNTSLCRTNRILMTENEFFITNIYGSEAYGNPANRYSGSSDVLFKPYPFVFYQGNASYISYVMYYDETNQRFIGMPSSYGFSTYCNTYSTDDGTLFYYDQTKYTPVRSLVYGENGYGNGGRSYALMTDEDGHFYVYGFLVARSPTKQLFNEIDLSVAVGLDKASHYAFFSMQSVILYSVGSQLWAYDYNRKDAKMIKDFGAEITYLAMDYHSNNTPTDFIVATYSASEKGIVRKFTIADNPNKIEITPHEKEIWNTDLKVVKVEYRNSTL